MTKKPQNWRAVRWCIGIAAIAVTAVATAAVAALPRDDLAFRILRSDDPIGSHRVTFSREGPDLVVSIEIDIAVKVAFLTLYEYAHRNTERWRDGRLLALETRTNDDGDRYRVSAYATAQGLVVEGQHGRVIAPADIVPTSYWNPATVTQTRLLDTQHGRIVDVSIERAGVERVDGRPATRYRMRGDLDLDLWYDDDGRWRTIEFEARGARIHYDPAQGGAAATPEGAASARLPR